MSGDKHSAIQRRMLDDIFPTADATATGHLSAEELVTYALGRLQPDELLRADQHLSTCVECLTLVEQAVDAVAVLPGSETDESLEAVNERQVLDLLTTHDAIEREFDYVLPSGLHSDTHVNLGKLCWTDQGLDNLARLLDRRLNGRRFDLIISHGWPMAAVARRMAWKYRAAVSTLVESQGYEAPALSHSIGPNRSALILIDVAVTGGLARRLSAMVVDSGSHVAAIAAIVDARIERKQPEVLSLCTVAIRRWNESDCPLTGVLEERVFNPVSYRMTTKKDAGRSPVSLFNSDSEFSDLWTAIYRAGAYQRHRIDGQVHYNGFIDTEKLLEHPVTGPQLVSEIGRRILAGTSDTPDVLVVPQRHRGRLFGTRLREFIYGETGKIPELIVVGIRRGRAVITDAVERKLYKRFVLVCDSATSHGGTLDTLCYRVTRLGAADVGAAVLVSRLKESCEEAFRNRLNGRFWRLYYFPLPAFWVEGNSREACPFCALRADIDGLARRLGLRALKELAESFVEGRGDRSQRGSLKPRPEPSNGDDLLQRCERRIAGGVTLHTLLTAMNDGMAPLELPEISAPWLPANKRAAMLESLPAGTIKWSGQSFERELMNCLAEEPSHQVWLAAANLFAREGRGEWLDRLGTQLSRPGCNRLPAQFWGWLVYDAVKYVQAQPAKASEAKTIIQRVRQSADRKLKQSLDEIARAIDEAASEPAP